MQDGIFQYKRIPMSVLAVPGWFQHVIHNVLDAGEVDVVSAYLDDITAGGIVADWRQCWDATLRVRRMLARFGLMIKLKKCKLLFSNTAVLGFEFCNQGYMLGQKFMW